MNKKAVKSLNTKAYYFTGFPKLDSLHYYPHLNVKNKDSKEMLGNFNISTNHT